MSHREMSPEDFEAMKHLRLGEFSDIELSWSAEVIKQNVEHAIARGAGEACIWFWEYLRLVFLDELNGRQKPV